VNLEQALNDYLRIRRSLGFRLQQQASSLRNFVAFLRTEGASHITTELALRWATQPAKAHPAAAASTSESGWAVQLGVFASRENAERLALEVRVKGFKASVSPVTSGSRKLYRVRVGPTADRAAAQELQGRLKAVGRPGGTVVPYS